ncbi:hypothetical protein BH09ACT10_BH09ACT10_27520 [soil metagenome]
MAMPGLLDRSTKLADGRLARRPLWRRSVPLSRESASDRISAYVYGNVLLLSALVLLTNSEVDSGRGFVLAAGTALSTFVAHVFSETLGAQAREVPHSALTLLRDSVPVLTSATVPPDACITPCRGLHHRPHRADQLHPRSTAR